MEKSYIGSFLDLAHSYGWSHPEYSGNSLIKYDNKDTGYTIYLNYRSKYIKIFCIYRDNKEVFFKDGLSLGELKALVKVFGQKLK